ncbi:MAG TPA: hypothetical protein VLF89_01460 [Candidatus Saccharimonadales bacterium]|nr:hypothetical protein [Candidatus Saccharimonadales bacterium]
MIELAERPNIQGNKPAPFPNSSLAELTSQDFSIQNVENPVTTIETSFPGVLGDVLAHKRDERILSNLDYSYAFGVIPEASNPDIIPSLKPFVPRAEAPLLAKNEPIIIFSGDKGGDGIVRANMSQGSGDREKEIEAINIIDQKLRIAREELNEAEALLKGGLPVNRDSLIGYRRQIKDLEEKRNQTFLHNIDPDILDEVNERLGVSEEEGPSTDIEERASELILRAELREEERANRWKIWQQTYTVIDSEGGTFQVSEKRWKELREEGRIDRTGNILSDQEYEEFISQQSNPSQQGERLPDGRLRDTPEREKDMKKFIIKELNFDPSAAEIIAKSKLGRELTPEEQEYLQDLNNRFGDDFQKLDDEYY